MFGGETLKLWTERFLVPVDDPGSRLFHMNILSSLLLILLFWIWQRHSGIRLDLKGLLLRKKYWWNRSTKIDYQVYFFNSVLKVLLFIPFLDFGFRFSQWTVKGLLWGHGDFGGTPATSLNLFLFTLMAFVWDDFLRFFHHYLMHRIPFLWEFHKTHHSARVLTPITLYRTHPLESAMATIRNSLSLGVAAGAFIFLFESQMSLMTLFGVNLFGFVFNFLGSNLRHSHIPLSFGIFENIFISPKMHQVHHSRDVRHFDKNFGVSFSFWDLMFQSRILSGGVGSIRVGLDERHASTLFGHLVGPVTKLFSRRFHIQDPLNSPNVRDDFARDTGLGYSRDPKTKEMSS